MCLGLLERSMLMNNYKADFPVLMKNPNLRYFDTAATALVPMVVIDAIQEYYTDYPASVHRGLYPMSEKATATFEQARKTVADFLEAKSDQIIFTSGTTHGINLLASQLSDRCEKGDNIVLTRYEHHANLLPWQVIAKEKGVELRFIELTKNLTLDMTSAQELIDSKTKIVSFSAVSNSIGSISPTKELISIAKKVNAITIVDAAQAVGHIPFSMKELGCDAAVFSGHKIYGPTGVGVLCATQELLANIDPFFLGGGMVSESSYTDATWLPVPQKMESGTPNISGVIGLDAAITYIQQIGIDQIQMHEKHLTSYALKKLLEIPSVTIIGPQKQRSGVISFIIDGIHTHDIADLLGKKEIAVRAGHHCAMPLMKHLALNGTSRISFGIYNTEEDIDILIQELKNIIDLFSI